MADGESSPESSSTASPDSGSAAGAAPTAGGGASLGTVLAVGLGLALLAGGWWFTRPDKLHVLVISLDTTRPDHLGAYGATDSPTPNLDRLAAEGTVFEGARTTAPWTLPSHMSLFTGLPPELHGVRYDWHRLPPDRRMMGQVFRQAGFRTVGIYTAPYVHPTFGFGRGMEFYEPATQKAMLHDRSTRGMTPEQQQALVLETELQSHAEVTSAQVAQRFNFFARHNPADRNFFFLHFFDPHYDYLPPPSHRAARVDPEYAGPISGREIMASASLIRPGMPAADLKQLKDLYDAELRYTDAQLGKILATLEETGELENTIIAVVADHGEAFLEHDVFGHRQDLSEEVLRIPMIFWGPGRVPAGKRVDAPVSLVDVLPTLVDLAELPPEPDLYGRSLRPLMEGAEQDRRVTSLLDYISQSATDSYERHESLVYRDLKFVRIDHVAWSPETRTDFSGAPDPERRTEAVFDLSSDPQERVNLLETRPDDPEVQAVRKLFYDEIDRRRSFAAERSWREAEISDVDIAVLNALGYTGELGQ